VSEVTLYGNQRWWFLRGETTQQEPFHLLRLVARVRDLTFSFYYISHPAIYCADFKHGVFENSIAQNVIGQFWEKQRVECGGRLKIKIHILFYGDNSWTVTLRPMKFRAVKDISTSSIWIIVFFHKRLLNMAMVRNFEIMLRQTLNHSVWNSVILCNVMPL
jgi:hypothetical protein